MMNVEEAILIPEYQQSLSKIYEHLWEYQHIPVGVYDKKNNTIEKAAQNAIVKMVKKMPSLKKSFKLLCVGLGSSPTAEYLSEKYGSKIACLQFFPLEEKHKPKETDSKKKSKAPITYTTGHLAQLPFERATFDIVWVQDTVMYSTDKRKVFREVARVLKPEGRFIFTDIMRTLLCPEEAFDEYPQIPLETMTTAHSYKRIANRVDLEKVFLKEMPDHVTTHYANMIATIEAAKSDLVKKTSQKTVEQALELLQTWHTVSEQKYLNWGILQFQKRNV